MSSRKKSRGGRPSKWPPAFRRDAVAMVLDEERSIADVARATGVHAGTLGRWVGLERVERGERDRLTAEERSDMAELRAERRAFRVPPRATTPSNCRSGAAKERAHPMLSLCRGRNGHQGP